MKPKENSLIDTQKILNHLYRSNANHSRNSGRTYVISGRPDNNNNNSNTSNNTVKRKSSSAFRNSNDTTTSNTKSRYYMSAKRIDDVSGGGLKIDSKSASKPSGPKSALSRLVEEKYIDHKHRHAWSLKSESKKKNSDNR